MFPALSEDYLKVQQCSWDFDAAVEKLKSPLANSSTLQASNQPSTSRANSPLLPSDLFCAPKVSASVLLREYFSKTMCKSEFVQLDVDRERLWWIALGFYKNCKCNPTLLRKELRVEFKGEGIDTDALRSELLLRELILKEMIFVDFPRKIVTCN